MIGISISHYTLMLIRRIDIKVAIESLYDDTTGEAETYWAINNIATNPVGLTVDQGAVVNTNL